jgi:hypothetical protein
LAKEGKEEEKEEEEEEEEKRKVEKKGKTRSHIYIKSGVHRHDGLNHMIDLELLGFLVLA